MGVACARKLEVVQGSTKGRTKKVSRTAKPAVAAKKKASKSAAAKNAVTLEVVKKQGLTSRQRTQLVVQYRLKARKLARSILRKWHARLDLEEVDSVVDLSLCEAVKRFDPSVGASFMTFLYYHLRGNLIRAVSYAATAYLAPVEGDQVYSLDGAANPGRMLSAVEIADALCGVEAALPDEVLLQKEVADLSRRACMSLDELEREVIERIFLQGEQLIQVAESLGYSRCHISRVKKKALQVLHKALQSELDLSTDLLAEAEEDSRGRITKGRAAGRNEMSAILLDERRKERSAKRTVKAKATEKPETANDLKHAA